MQALSAGYHRKPIASDHASLRTGLGDAARIVLQIESMETDPYNILGNVRARTANELLHAFGHIAHHEAELELPIYAHHGTKDRLANLGVGYIPL